MKPNAEAQRKYRLKKAISYVINNFYNESYFITLTFNEDFFKSSTKEKRFLIVKGFLNNQCDYYILNCDYGAINEREHYHALTIAKDKFINFNLYRAKYGNINVKPISLIRNQSKESKIDYLFNHALKETTTKKIIYSKSKRPTHKPKNKKSYFLPNEKKQKFINEKIRENINLKLKEKEKQKEHEENIKTLINKHTKRSLF